jgi:phosphatidylserine/phosphatidylglycerophosphate/cardiolipin synthase-like enzyme
MNGLPAAHGGTPEVLMRVLYIGLVALCLHCGGTQGPENTPADPAPAAVVPVPDPEAPAPPVANAPVPSGQANASEPEAPACNATDPRATPVALWVLPQAGEKPFVDFLASATKSIVVFGYLMGFGGILDTLKAKAQAGVDVRVILDGVTQRDVNDKYRLQLEAAGAKFQWSDPKFSYMHAKSMVVDGREALVTTGNYSRSYMLKERNYVARITDAQDVSDLAALFDADWSKKTPDLSCTRLLVSPINAQPRLVALIKSAKTSIDIESMQFSDKAVQDAVFERKAAGVSVRVILAAPGWIETNDGVGDELKKKAIAARWLGTPGVHVKAIVVDGAQAYLGSENISYTSLTKNREVGVIISDTSALTSMHDTFETDWANATNF